jgi:uncharacterized protein (DUF1684 family)
MRDLSEVTQQVLTEAISAITILGVDRHISIENDAVIYIKTDDLNTVDRSALKSIEYAYSDEQFKVTFRIADFCVDGTVRTKNTNTVSLYIQQSCDH